MSVFRINPVLQASRVLPSPPPLQYTSLIYLSQKEARYGRFGVATYRWLRRCRSLSYNSGVKDSGEKASHGRPKTIDDAITDDKERQTRTPWHREGANEPPVRRPRSAGAMTKGKLLTTPSRLLKLVLPLTTKDSNTDRKDVEPLALLVHPQQPLSYLERLIQSELPSITTDKGENRIPNVSFRAVESADDEIRPKKQTPDEERETSKDNAPSRGGPGQGGVEFYSGLGREGSDSDHGRLVRWSSSTEIGDFIRDAARAKEFAVEIEGARNAIMVGVPSFKDRTHYLRVRLRKTARKIYEMSTLKEECDIAAHQGGQRLAVAGFGGVIGWWCLVCYLTFKTDLGWDTMEPVTYLVGLSAVILGYFWFLYHNREVSYRSALNFTISRRQNKLYQAKGLDLHRWENLVEEANALRKEIKAVASEYDVEWDEAADEHSEEVANTLRKERQKFQKSTEGSKKDEDENED